MVMPIIHRSWLILAGDGEWPFIWATLAVRTGSFEQMLAQDNARARRRLTRPRARE